MELAVEEWKTSLRYNPHFSRSRVNLATAYSILGETEKAIEEYNRALLYDSSLHHAAYYGLARIHHGQGNLERAIEYYLRAIETNPRFEIAHLGLGRAYQEKGLFEKATEEAMKVLELNPDSEEARRLLMGR
jgi:tetratricopeptide (TPR) repeat protein